MLHNLLHRCGFSKENEWEYIPKNTDSFIGSLNNTEFFRWIGEIISFTGWIGVCVFVFFSGYGLQKKYGSDTLKVERFIFEHWKKLFILMLPGTLFLILAHWDIGGVKYLFSLTMFGNLLYKESIPVGVYWYFGLTFEIYLAWLLIRKCSDKTLLGIATGFIVLQAFFVDTSNMEYIKTNIFGWAQVFILGMLVAKSANPKQLAIFNWGGGLLMLF